VPLPHTSGSSKGVSDMEGRCPKHKSIKKEEKGDNKGTKKAYLMAIMKSTFNITIHPLGMDCWEFFLLQYPLDG